MISDITKQISLGVVRSLLLYVLYVKSKIMEIKATPTHMQIFCFWFMAVRKQNMLEQNKALQCNS